MREGGFSILEILIAIGLLGLVAGAFLSTLLTLDVQRAQTRDRDIASAAAQARLDLLRSDRDFRTLYARLLSSSDFDVPGLRPLAGRRVGKILLPAPLRENSEAPAFGLPRDLNLDGRIDGGDRAGDYRFLPVRVRLEWQGPVGPQEWELYTVLSHAKR